jgi:hypothetical protein
MVVTLVADAERAAAAESALRGREGVEIGPCFGRRLAVTGQTGSAAADRALVEWIEGLPGVEWLDVVFVAVDQEEPGGCCA